MVIWIVIVIEALAFRAIIHRILIKNLKILKNPMAPMALMVLIKVIQRIIIRMAVIAILEMPRKKVLVLSNQFPLLNEELRSL